MNSDHEYIKVLASLEGTVFVFYHENPQLTDYQVDKAFEALLQAYRGEAIGKTIAPPRGELVGPLFQQLKIVCEMWLGRSGSQKEISLAKGNIISMETLVDCLKRLRKSIDQLTRERGNQGYLMYITQFMQEMDDLGDPETESDEIYQFKITLDGIRPPIWRRFQVRASDTLYDLHKTIQSVMGWTNSHLHEFEIAGQTYGDPLNDEFGDIGIEDEAEYYLEEVIQREGQRVRYLYDFGDSWEHTLLLEKILEVEEGQMYPRCLKGRRACPPEDVGGVWGYEQFLEAINDPDDPEHEEYLVWAGEDFDPEAFDLDVTNEYLLRDFFQNRVEAMEMLSQVLQLPYEDEAEKLPLRKDAAAFVAYLKENKVTGTKQTGNLPRKAVREIAERFVNPPELDRELNGKIHSFQSESDVHEVFFLHLLLENAGLIKLRQDRRWILTELGEESSNMPAVLQVWLLFSNWWFMGNWYHLDYIKPFPEEALDFFKDSSLDLLLDYDADETVIYADFIERLIQEMGLTYGILNKDYAMNLLKTGVEDLLIDLLEKFGMLQKETRVNEYNGQERKELYSFKLTPFGKAVLEIIG